MARGWSALRGRVGTVRASLWVTRLKSKTEDGYETNDEDVLVIYDSLLKGSYNHLRAFVSQIDRFYDDYEPTVLPQDEYDEIIGSTSSGPGGVGQGPTDWAPRGRRG